MNAMPLIVSADDLRRALSPAAAVRAVEDALRSGLDPAADIERTFVDVDRGQVALMPSSTSAHVGVKIVTVAPGNPELGLDRIQGVYVLFDAHTLGPRALIDAPELTTLRTPAVSVAATRSVLDRSGAPLRIVVFGAGPQGTGHVATLVDVCAGVREIASVTYVVRTPDRAVDLPGPDPVVVAAHSPAADDAVAEADVIVCATGSAVPVFDSGRVRGDVVVIAVGSHEADRREVDSAFCARAQVVVEDVETALREAGEVVTAIADGVLGVGDLIAMRDVVTGAIELRPGTPVLFKGSGMAWEDVVVAEAAVAAVVDREGVASARR